MKRFPWTIEQFLLENYGKLMSVEELNGVNKRKGTSCFRLFFEEKSFIVKKAKKKENMMFTKLFHLISEIRKLLFLRYITLIKKE
ncbi:hypothetical protein [Priestia aryabhattai]|uniref:hypothetical protein n=1 Tax=Priestia aryabhattai TaxID=412384 RepID=UPI002452FEAE|nr:hypothetical protein [Priestia aryabhattai]MDH3111322.1 hypothetical protein [Priestia aryabhattai]MDH3129904.1 hypothetical protein [Priestia aryabhattai]